MDKKNRRRCRLTRSIPAPSFIPASMLPDCTVPRLAKLCEVRPRGMMQIRDELAGVFSSMRSAGSRPFYLEAWNGDRFVVERVDGDAVSLRRESVGRCDRWNSARPDRKCICRRSDGLYGRFLFAGQ